MIAISGYVTKLGKKKSLFLLSSSKGKRPSIIIYHGFEALANKPTQIVCW
jgi:hypothetical protein